MIFNIYDPQFHLNEREARIFALSDSLCFQRVFRTEGNSQIAAWEQELATLKAARFTDIPTSRAHPKENKKRAADRQFALA